MRISRYRAFTALPRGGNPAAVVTDAEDLDAVEMQQIAADVGYSETAFVKRTPLPDTYDVRYFAPLTEIPFCGHATIAAAVAIGADAPPADRLTFNVESGQLPIALTSSNGVFKAEISTVPPRTRPATRQEVPEALAALGWGETAIDPRFPVRVAYAGAWHLVLGLRHRDTLAALAYDIERMAALSEQMGIATVQLFWRESSAIYHSRNPFPVGGVYEDPATGAAAAALGAYLRELGHYTGDAAFTVIQGEDMGSRSEIAVRLVLGDPRVRIAGTATLIAPNEPRTQAGLFRGVTQPESKVR